MRRWEALLATLRGSVHATDIVVDALQTKEGKAAIFTKVRPIYSIRNVSDFRR